MYNHNRNLLRVVVTVCDLSYSIRDIFMNPLKVMEDHVFVKEKQEKVDFSMPECDVTLALRSDKCDSRKTSCVPETNTTT